MKNINLTIVVVAIIVAITIIAAMIILKPTSSQEANTIQTPEESEVVTPGGETNNGGLEAPEEPAPLPPATEPSEDPGDPVVEPDSPEEAGPVACTLDVQQCPDGSYVGRVAPNCEFAPCPPPEEEGVGPVACTMDVKQCPDGSYVGRVAPDCEFEACPITNPGLQLQLQP